MMLTTGKIYTAVILSLQVTDNVTATNTRYTNAELDQLETNRDNIAEVGSFCFQSKKLHNWFDFMNIMLCYVMIMSFSLTYVCLTTMPPYPT